MFKQYFPIAREAKMETKIITQKMSFKWEF